MLSISFLPPSLPSFLDYLLQMNINRRKKDKNKKTRGCESSFFFWMLFSSPFSPLFVLSLPLSDVGPQSGNQKSEARLYVNREKSENKMKKKKEVQNRHNNQAIKQLGERAKGIETHLRINYSLLIHCVVSRSRV
jgi:hypothetical protein